jgi:hypothetical protein
MSEYKFLPNLGYLEHVFTEKQLRIARESVSRLSQDFAKAEPVYWDMPGALEHEYMMEEKGRLHMEYLLAPMLREIRKNTPGYSMDVNRVLTMGRPWVTFRQQGEISPYQVGADVLTWVLWLEIPFDPQTEQLAKPGKNSKSQQGGMFELGYTDTQGRITKRQFALDKTFENRVMIFPSGWSFGHTPFYTPGDPMIYVTGVFRIASPSLEHKCAIHG